MKKNSHRQDNKHIRMATVPALVFMLYVILDYLNIPQILGISSNRINTDFFTVFLDSTIVVTLYIATYYLVDSRQIKKDANARDVANTLLLCTYRACIANLERVCDTVKVKEYIIPKVDGNKPIDDNKVVSNLQNLPFTANGEILELSKSGYIEKCVLEKYLSIQREYKNIVAMKIIFYDLPNSALERHQTLNAEFDCQWYKLMCMLHDEVRRLEVS